ncbi:hypothetical protein [Methanotorris formicicus]|uniref:hypothetical protein n=1 Tax=Methanotorris formicicus TaxID=213185 RepID=UPI0011451C31|nr:hypothetical protein [Methanotorris formicicus]
MLSLMLGIVGGILWILFYEKFRLAAFNVVMTILYFIFACLIRTKMGKIELDEFAVDISNKVSHDLLISFGVFICVLVTYSLTKPIILNPHGVGSFAFFILFGYNCLFYFYYRKYVGGDNE